ncbi:MAG: GNAT family N-acetyltransferase [Thermoleophilaceae bacterium]
MNVSLVSPASLSAEDVLRWSEIQRQTSSLASPFFCPEFTAIVGAVRDDVAVARLEDGGRTLGFFPFERGRYGEGRPVGSILSDYHGVVAAPDIGIGSDELVRSCGLKTWEFHHLVAAQASFKPYVRARRNSAVIDLSRGFGAYSQGRRDAGVRRLAAIARQARKIEREQGPLAYSHHSLDESAFDTLLRWKADQYKRTGAAEILRHEWIRGVLTRVWRSDGDGFGGMLSTLSAGGRLVAVHLGMRSSRVWHYWFPAYDPALAAYSPGLILLLRMAESAPSLGLKAIDLGTGDDQYKKRLMSYVVPLAVGSVETPSLAAFAGRTRRAAVSFVRRTSLAPKLRPVVRGIAAHLPRR